MFELFQCTDPSPEVSGDCDYLIEEAVNDHFVVSLQEKEGEASDEMDGTAEEQLIDFREYLLSALLLVKFKAPVIQLLELAFKVRSMPVGQMLPDGMKLSRNWFHNRITFSVVRGSRAQRDIHQNDLPSDGQEEAWQGNGLGAAIQGNQKGGRRRGPSDIW